MKMPIGVRNQKEKMRIKRSNQAQMTNWTYLKKIRLIKMMTPMVPLHMVLMTMRRKMKEIIHKK